MYATARSDAALHSLDPLPNVHACPIRAERGVPGGSPDVTPTVDSSLDPHPLMVSTIVLETLGPPVMIAWQRSLSATSGHICP